ncbi:hypothetical protein [Agitococcus lubricus]|uniref:Uncharacterized protein n=1 Tax=Agitococcus lubricus TaxID=1077255 RepID=A0A2T5IY71_9GAMM|nr:hypothetical protein [Agitococcus lubricus]PTQ88918.1 hypothetical protein C8N29_11067 [Agitococcus lubricus]
MSSLIYLSYQQHDVILDRDFQFIILANGLDVLSESTYRLMMGKLADIGQTEKWVALATLQQWLSAVRMELACANSSLSNIRVKLAHQDAELIHQTVKQTLEDLDQLVIQVHKAEETQILSCCI